jgi:hypothetical protein
MKKVLLENNNKELKKGIKITINTILNNSIDKIWNKLVDIETLIYICKPMATFKIVSNEQYMKWELNREYIFKLFIFGFIPFGYHKIVLEIIDEENKIIKSKEHNTIVKIWNHTIIIRKIEENTIEYIDEVEIYAGIFTLFIALWGTIFYKHRQKKWRKIVKKL